MLGRHGCGDAELAQRVARRAVREGLSPALVAGVVATESSCRPYAVSDKGAVGLMQVRVSVWARVFDPAEHNYFDPDTNLAIGTQILREYIERYGEHEGLRRYNGALGRGEGPWVYAQRVLELANTN